MSNKIFVLVEHRNEEIRDITYELLTKGRTLAEKSGGELTALLLGSNVDKFTEKLKPHAHYILAVNDEKLKNFNAETYQIVLSDIIRKEPPFLTLIGHTASGVDLAPSLATELDIPLTTDCILVDIDGNKLTATRQVYGGKLNASISFIDSQSYIITVRQTAFPAQNGNLNGEVKTFPATIIDSDYRKFIEYLEAVAGEVDITKANVVIGVGRGIREKDNMRLVEEFANSLGGVLACSRPIVDAGWLPKDRQIGSSGKVVKPKLYIAIGISGSFQHISGIKGAETIVAINKDPNAPIFNEADYGIVDDLFKIVPTLTGKILEIL